MPGVSELADAVREGPQARDARHLEARLSEGDFLHPALGLVVLLTVHVLNVYKPSGMTRYGRRRLQEERGSVRLREPAEL